MSEEVNRVTTQSGVFFWGDEDVWEQDRGSVCIAL
jgi:hypothetical protein